MESNKQAEIDVRSRDFMNKEIHKPFGHGYGASYWAKWGAVDYAFADLGIGRGAEVLDLGCGAGWTTAFLGQSGYKVTGLDIVPLNVETGNKRARALKIDAKVEVGDMEKFSLGKKFDAVLVFDSLHHSAKQTQVIDRISKHLKPGGWVLFGEPSLLHKISPHARATTRNQGVLERGITAWSLRKDCKKAGLVSYKRYYEGTHPYKSRLTGYLWQLVRLSSANIALAPQTSIWFAAQKPPKR